MESKRVFFVAHLEPSGWVSNRCPIAIAGQTFPRRFFAVEFNPLKSNLQENSQSFFSRHMEYPGFMASHTYTPIP